MGFEELAAFVEKLALPAHEAVALADLVLAQCGHLLEDVLFRFEPQVVAELVALVVVGNELFDVFDQHGPLVAAAGISLSADAGEVGVDATGVAAGVADDEPAAAAAAPDRPLEVVVVLPLLLAGEVLGFEDPLYFVEDPLADEGRVLALVADAAVVDDADVVRVAEEVVEGGDCDLLTRPLWCRSADKALRRQLVEERADGPLARCIHLERLLHERSALRVYLD